MAVVLTEMDELVLVERGWESVTQEMELAMPVPFGAW